MKRRALGILAAAVLLVALLPAFPAGAETITIIDETATATTLQITQAEAQEGWTTSIPRAHLPAWIQQVSASLAQAFTVALAGQPIWQIGLVLNSTMDLALPAYQQTTVTIVTLAALVLAAILTTIMVNRGLTTLGRSAAYWRIRRLGFVLQPAFIDSRSVRITGIGFEDPQEYRRSILLRRIRRGDFGQLMSPTVPI